MDILSIPHYGSGNPYQCELAEALERCGVKVTLCGPVGYFPLLDAVRTCGKPDVLHLHWTSPLLVSASRCKSVTKSMRSILELLWFKVRGIKLVWTIHNITHHECTSPRIERFFRGILARFCNQIIVHCSSAQDAVMQAYRLPDHVESKISVIAHGHYIHSYVNHIPPSQARGHLGFDDREIIFLYFGQIRPYKGVLHLVAAFEEMNDPLAHLLIAGRPLNRMIQMQLEDIGKANHRIHLHLGFIPEDEIQIYMNAADVVVLPYQNVLTSGSLLLAMSFGKAVIAPRLGCIAEVLAHRGGLLYDPNREDGLLHAMRQALNADLPAMGRHNYMRSSQFDWDEIAQKTYKVYQRCFA